MQDESKYDVCKFSLCPVGGKRNPVASRKPDRLDQGREGFARFIREAKDLTEIQNSICNYFLDSRKPDEDTATTFLDNFSEEELTNSVKRMREQFEKLSSEEDKSRLALERKRRALHHAAEHSSSSPKIAKMTQPLIDADKGAAGASGSDTRPQNNITARSKKFSKVLKEEFRKLKGKLTRMSHPPLQSYDSDLEEFTVHNEEKIDELQFFLHTIGKNITELEKMLEETDLPIEEFVPRKLIDYDILYEEPYEPVHHLLFVPMSLKPLVENIVLYSAFTMKKWEKLRNKFRKKSPEESAVLERQLDTWIARFHRCGKMITQGSTDSTDTLQGIPPMQDDDGSQG